jgi:hypothetical protein
MAITLYWQMEMKLLSGLEEVELAEKAARRGVVVGVEEARAEVEGSLKPLLLLIPRLLSFHLNSLMPIRM